jgi:hypothetical protein
MRINWLPETAFVVVVASCTLTSIVEGGACLARAISSAAVQSHTAQSKSRPFYERLFGHQLPVSTDTRTWRIRLDGKEKCNECPGGIAFAFTAVEKASGKHYQFRMTNSPDQVDEVDVIGKSRAVIFGRIAQNAVLVNLISLPIGSVLDNFMCFWPSLSPDHHFLAYVKYFPGHPGPVDITNEYIVYDLTKTAAENRMSVRKGTAYDVGLPIYPPGATNAANEFVAPDALSAHVMVSDGLFWLDETDTVCFVDRWRAADSLIVADVSRGVRHTNVTAHKLDVTRMVDMAACQKTTSPSDFKAWSKDPASLVSITDITLSQPGASGVLLTMAPHPCLTSASITVPLSK